MQILREFQRICAIVQEPAELFYQKLDLMAEPLLEFFSNRTGQVKHKMQDILDVLKEQVIKSARFKLFLLNKAWFILQSDDCAHDEHIRTL